MARFGQAFINSLTNPSYGQGLFTAAQQFGAAPAVAQEKQQRSKAMDIVNQALASNNPEQLLQAAQAIKGFDPESAMKLSQAAGQLRQQTETNRKGRGLQGGLVAIQQAASRGIPLEKLTEASRSVIGLGGTQEQIDAAYQAGLTKPTKATTKIETIKLPDGVEQKVAYSFDEVGNIVNTQMLGAAPSKGSKEGLTSNLQKQLKEAGFEGDLTTLEGAKQARDFAILNIGNASLANSIDNIVEDLTPISIRESMDTIRDLRPDFVKAESDREMVERYRTLDSLNDQDVAGLSALIERTLTATTENDVKAASELARFRSASSLTQRFNDFVQMSVTGKLSEDTLKEYGQIMTALDELAKIRMGRAFDDLIIIGSEKESEAAKRARAFVFGDDSAKIIGSQ